MFHIHEFLSLSALSREIVCRAFRSTEIEDNTFLVHFNTFISRNAGESSNKASAHDTWYTRYRFSASTNPLSIKNGVFIRDRLRRAFVQAALKS